MRATRLPGTGLPPAVANLLKAKKLSLQANAKVSEGRQHPDRDAQFRYLADMAQGFIDDGQPAISVDTKKKELIGEFANAGGRSGSPRASPNGSACTTSLILIWARPSRTGSTICTTTGWVNVGDVPDTAEFAVNSIRAWWYQMGRARSLTPTDF